MSISTALPNQLLSSILDSLETGVLVLNQTGEIVWFNDYFRQLLTLKDSTVSQYEQQQLQDTSFLQNLIRNQEFITLYDSKGDARQLFHLQQSLLDEKETPFTVHYYYDRSRETALKSNLCLMRDKLIDSQFRDPITGFLNIKAFKLVMEPQIARCRRYRTPLTTVTLQLAYVNEPDNLDQHADHIRKTSQVLKDCVRWADQMHYDSQGIFSLVLPETHASDAQVLADKIESRLLTFQWLKSVNFGATEWVKTDTLNTFMRRAKLALESSIQQNLKISIL